MYSLKAARATLVLIAILIGCADAALASGAADAAEGTYFSANALYNRGLYKLAIPEYESFLQKYPTHPKAAQAHLGLALSYYGAGDYAKAEPKLTAARRTAKGDTANQLDLMRGQSLLLLKRVPESEKVYAITARAAKGSVRAAALLGLTEARYQQQNWDGVVNSGDALLREAPADPNAPRVRFQVGVAHYRMKRYAESTQALAALVSAKDQPALSHQACYIQAECQRELNDLDKAAASYTRVAGEKNGAYALEARYRLGFVRALQNRHADTANEMAAYLKAAPSGQLAAPARRALGRAYVNLKRYREAETALKPLATANPPDADAVLWLARCYSRQGRTDVAVGVLAPALQRVGKTPLYPALLFDLGQAQLAINKHTEAATSLGRIVTEFATWDQAPDALRLKAIAEHRGGQYDKSLASCTAFLAKHADHDGAAEMAFVKAEDLLLLKRDEEALAAYQAYLDAHGKDSRVPAAGFRTVQILHRLERWDKALERALPFAAKPPADPLFEPLWYLIGDCHFRLEAWQQAETFLKRFTAKPANTPNRDVALLELGLARARLGNSPEAQTTLNQLISTYRQSPQRPLALVELGRLRYEAKQYAPAQQAFRGVPASPGVTPDSIAQATYYLGWIDADLGRSKEAAAQFQALIAKHADHALVPDALLQLGRMQLKQNAFAPAAATLDKLVKSFPKFNKTDHARFYLGVAQARQERWQQAVPPLEGVISQHPDSTLRDRVFYELAWCRKRLNDTNGATKAYTAILAIKPRSALADRAAFELAEVEFDTERFDEAIVRLKALLATLKDAELREQALYRLGWCHVSKADHAAAAETFETLLREFPKSSFIAQAAFQAGEARMARDEHQAARGHFETAYAHKTVKEVHEPALLRLGETRALTGQWPQAEAAYLEFTRSYAPSEWIRRAWLGLGWARENLRRYPDAIQAYNKGLEGNARDETAARCQFQIGECLFAMKKPNEAVRALIKVNVTYGYPKWSARALLESGRVFEQQGEYDRATAQYEEVISKYGATDAASVAKKRLTALKQKATP